MATTCEHVAPGDLITAEFVNCLLDKIEALEKRVQELEKTEVPAEWKDYFTDLLKDYLKFNDSRLQNQFDRVLKVDDSRLSDVLKDWLKADDPRLKIQLDPLLKYNDSRIPEVMKDWLKADDSRLKTQLDGLLKVDDSRLGGVFDDFISSKKLVVESKLGDLVTSDAITQKLSANFASKTTFDALSTDVKEVSTLMTQVNATSFTSEGQTNLGALKLRISGR